LRPESLLKSQIALGEIAYANFGKKGFNVEGKPIVASNVGKAMRGKIFKKAKEPEWKRMFDRIKREIVVEA
jgi:hypothetical protein